MLDREGLVLDAADPSAMMTAASIPVSGIASTNSRRQSGRSGPSRGWSCGSAGELPQHLVADVVSIGVVHRLEMVDVENHQRDGLPLWRQDRPAWQGGFEVAAIVEASQRVEERHSIDACTLSRKRPRTASCRSGCHARQQLVPVDRPHQVVVDAEVGPRSSARVSGSTRIRIGRLRVRSSERNWLHSLRPSKSLRPRLTRQDRSRLRRPRTALRWSVATHRVLGSVVNSARRTRRSSTSNNRPAAGSATRRARRPRRRSLRRHGARAQLVGQHLQPHQRAHVRDQRHVAPAWSGSRRRRPRDPSPGRTAGRARSGSPPEGAGYGVRFSRRQTSKPSMSGIITSSRTISHSARSAWPSPRCRYRPWRPRNIRRSAAPQAALRWRECHRRPVTRAHSPSGSPRKAGSSP